MGEAMVAAARQAAVAVVVVTDMLPEPKPKR